MLELEDALTGILARIPNAKNETILLREACRRVAAETLLAPLDLPRFDNSSMDGYAVRAVDVAQATQDSPVRLHLVGRIAAGDAAKIELAAGQCVRVFTGSPLPSGADAVVMQEDTRIESGHPTEILILDSVKPWENIRFHGEDVKLETPLIQPGILLTASRIGLLAAMGFDTVKVGVRPVVGLLATGSELIEPGQELAPGQIYESNRSTLAPLIESAGGIPRTFPIIRDDPEITRKAIEQAFQECDLVVTCGGVSVGEMDFVKSAFETLGGKLEFWKVAIKPGRPFVFGELNAKFLFGLPGNPVSAFVTFLLLVRPALRLWQGATETSLPAGIGVLSESLSNPGERRHFMRVQIDGSGGVKPAGIQASHILSSLAAANGLLDLPPKASWPAGQTVTLLRWD